MASNESWKRYFTPAENTFVKGMNMTPYHASQKSDNSAKFTSFLPEVYSGAPNRIERYNQYDSMDLDSHVSASLDIISEFCTQVDGITGLPFKIKFNKEPNTSESKIVADELRKWTRLNEFNNRIFDIFRGVLKYGDQFFVRDPETFKMMFVHQSKVEKVVVNEGEGKKPEQYSIRDLDLNLQSLAATAIPITSAGSMPNMPGYPMAGSNQNPGNNTVSMGSRFSKTLGTINVNADHVVHISLNNGLDPQWPFGTSMLERVFKTFKQKDLIEDSVMIYMMQRAPERRVFYIDVGDLPENKAMAYVENLKNSIHQRRIPSKNGGNSVLDASYNPISMLEDFFFPQKCLALDTLILLADGRTLQLIEIIDLFSKGEDLLVYSINPDTMEQELGQIAWAGVTRRDALVMRITLSNGKTVIATPDHKFIDFRGKEIPAQALVVNDQLLSYDRTEIINVVTVEFLDGIQDTGDITIESPSGSHLFAIDAGIFVHNSDSRGSRVETLPGGDTGWGIEQLQYFDNKLARGLRVPSSYLPTGPDDGISTFNDGKVGTALIQEFRFAKYCERLQAVVIKNLDHEFKLYLKRKDYKLSADLFDLKFVEPQSFAAWRQIELDTSRINNFNSVIGQPFMSKRFCLKRYLGLDETDILNNERMVIEENPEKEEQLLGASLTDNHPDVDLKNVGFDVDALDQEDDFADTSAPAELPEPEITDQDQPEEEQQ